MKSWKLDRLGGRLRLEDTDLPQVRPGSVLVQVEASLLMSYLKPYVEGKLSVYDAPAGLFTPGGNCIGTIAAVGADVWHLAPGQRVAVSPHVVAAENVEEPGQFLLGVTAFGAVAKAMQAAWRDGTLAEYVLVPAAVVTPLAGLDHEPAARLAPLLRFAIPYGGLLRGRLRAGETLVVNGASGAYGSAAVLLALALGAARVVAAGRNAAALARLATAGGPRVAVVALSGDRAADAAALRTAAGGGAHMALDMVGDAGDATATLAALDSLRGHGRLVLMGSMRSELPLSYLQLMSRGLEIIGNFMHPRDALLRLAALAAADLLPLDAIVPSVFGLDALPAALSAAAHAHCLECVVLAPSPTHTRN